MAASGRTVRRLIAVGLAIGLVVGACDSSSSSANPSGPGGGSGGDAGNGASLTPGLSSNLDKLDSYQFVESNAGSFPAVGATAGNSGAYLISGTVINRPVESIWIGETNARFIVIGNEAWTSVDGNTWLATDPQGTILTDLLPGHDYGTWFDAKSTYFKPVGDESKNGVPCIHYTADSSLGSLYSSATGGAKFGADVWIAKDGNYPVSGLYGFSAATGSEGGSWGFSFDVTHVNDAANNVARPTNIVSLPTV
jgi:hypothetical protein